MPGRGPEGYDVVVAFGGDGTVNEAANGLVGSGTPLGCLPGGRTNVYCRLLGIPTDVVDATEHLLGMAHDWRPRPVDVGLVNERHFLFSAGVGLDASVVERVDAHPRLKVRMGEWYYAWTGGANVQPPLPAAPAAPAGRDRRRSRSTASPRSSRTPLRTRTSAIGRSTWARARHSTAVTWPASCSSRAGPIDIPTITWRALSRRARLVRHRRVYPFSAVTRLSVSSLDDRALPLQVDGDYIGEAREARFGVEPEGMLVVA